MARPVQDNGGRHHIAEDRPGDGTSRTQGTVDRHYPSIYPYGIPIGRVLNVGTSDIATFLTVTVAPFASFDSLDAVAALVSTKKR